MCWQSVTDEKMHSAGQEQRAARPYLCNDAGKNSAGDARPHAGGGKAGCRIEGGSEVALAKFDCCRAARVGGLAGWRSGATSKCRAGF